MKRYMAILGFVFVGVLAGLIVRGIPVVLHVNAGGGVPQTDRNGDVNGDASIDISDAVYILRHLFSGVPGPVALAQGEPGLAERITRTNELLEKVANPCSERLDRITNNGNGTVTDECSGLMWFRSVSWVDELLWEEAVLFCDNLEWGGFDDWRLPTAAELKTIMDDNSATGLRSEFGLMTELWTGEEVFPSEDQQAWAAILNFDPRWPLRPRFEPRWSQNRLRFLPVRTHR